MQVVDTEKDRESETSKRVEHIFSLLQKTGKINFWKFVADPTSFGRTVENIFHFAFLIKDGYARITKGADGAHIAGTKQALIVVRPLTFIDSINRTVASTNTRWLCFRKRY